VVDQVVAETMPAVGGPGREGPAAMLVAARTVRQYWQGVILDKRGFRLALLRATAATAGGMPYARYAPRQLIGRWATATTTGDGGRTMILRALGNKQRKDLVAAGQDGVERTWRQGERVRFTNAQGQVQEGELRECALQITKPDGSPQRYDPTPADQLVPFGTVRLPAGGWETVPLALLTLVPTGSGPVRD